MRIYIFGLLLALLIPLASCAQVVRAELGYQTTSRGIVWYRNGLPTKNPVWQLSRDTNKVMWCDTFTALRYDFDYKNDVWRTKGVSTSTLPPLPTQTSGAATIDNRTAFWRPANNILHRYDYNQTAWVPMSDFFYRSTAPSNVAAVGGTNGAAIYTTSLWQDSDDQIVRYWDGDSWEPFGRGQVVVITNVSEFASYPDGLNQELIVWRDANRGGVFVSKTTGSADGGTVFSGTGSTKWHRLMPDSRVNVKWFNATGDGTTDDYAAMQAAANYVGNNNLHLYFPTGTYISSGTVTIDSFSTVVVSGDGPNLSIVKRKNSQVGTLNRLLRIDGNGNDQVTVRDMGFDGNSANQTAPSPSTQWQQYHNLYLLCSGDHGFKSITLSNINSYNPLGDGISLAGSSSDGFGLANIVNVYEENRLYTRSSITVTANFDAVNITNFTGPVIECEPNGFSGSYKYNLNLTNVYCNQELDLNLLGARAAGRKGVCNAHGLYLKGLINSLGEFDFNVDGFYFQTTAQLRMAYGSYRFSNGTIKADSTFSETSLLTESASNPTDFAQFKNVQFTKHSAVSSITSYFIDDNAAGANTRVIFEGCQFNDAVRSAAVRAGKFDFINCIHTLTDTTSACVYTNGSTTHSGVTSEVNIINNTLPDYAYLFRPSISGTGQKFRVTGGNARDGHNILWDRFDKIDVEALQQNQNWYYENTATGLNASDFPKQGRWRIGDRLYYKAPAGKGAEWAECTVAGRADGTSATGATSGATFKKSGLHAVNTTGAVNGQVLKFNGSLWVPGNVDTSATNEAWTIDGDDSDTELISNQTVKFAGAGGATTDYDPGTNTLTITAPASGGNGIYGDGTPGSGDDNLPTGGSIVTTGGYPLNFSNNTSAGHVRPTIQIHTPYSADDAFTEYLSCYTPIDSFKIFNFDGSSWIQAYSGDLLLQTDQILHLTGDSIIAATLAQKTKTQAIVGISDNGTLQKIKGSSTDDVLKWTTGGWVAGAVPGGGGGGGITSLNGLTASTQTFATGTSGTDFGISSATSTHTFNLPTASATNRGALSSADWSTFNGKPGGSGTTNYVAYWSGTNTIAADADFQFDGTRVGIQGAPVSGFSLYTANAIRADGTLVTRGTGSSFISSSSTPHLRLWNTTASTGDIWYIGSEDDGELSITSGNLAAIQAKFTALGDLQLINAINQTVDAAPPSAPSDGVATYTTELANVQTPTWIDENGQIWESMASEASAKWAKWSASGNGTAVSTWAINNSESGTPTTVNIASTNLFTSMRRLQYQTAASGSSVAGTRHNNLSFWRGNAAGLGGFYFVCRFGFSVANTTNKQAFIGFRNSSSAIAGNTNPSSLTNMIGFGIDATQTTMRFFVNDGSGTATPTNLGANFPTNTNSTDMYEVRIFAAPNAGTVYYWAKNLSTGNTTSGSASSDLPSSTTFLCPHIWIGNGADATAVGIDVVQYSILTNY